MEGFEEPKEEEPILSKNARKKILKAERYAKGKAEWKAKLKEKRRIKKNLSRVSDDTSDTVPKENVSNTFIKRDVVACGKLIIDLSYDDLMTDSEIKSLASQIVRIYSVNRRTNFPFTICLFGFSDSPRLQARFKESFSEYENWKIEYIEKLPIDSRSVYLSADAQETITSPCHVNTDTNFIIGGLVDRNRHKSVAFNRALDLKIQSKKLPIDASKLKSSTVLTCVNVVELLIKCRELDDWNSAIESVIPLRKKK